MTSSRMEINAIKRLHLCGFWTIYLMFSIHWKWCRFAIHLVIDSGKLLFHFACHKSLIHLSFLNSCWLMRRIFFTSSFSRFWFISFWGLHLFSRTNRIFVFSIIKNESRNSYSFLPPALFIPFESVWKMLFSFSLCASN